MLEPGEYFDIDELIKELMTPKFGIIWAHQTPLWFWAEKTYNGQIIAPEHARKE